MNHHKTGMGGPVDVAGLNGEELVKKLQNDFASAENYEYLVQRVTKVENYIGDITSKVIFSSGLGCLPFSTKNYGPQSDFGRFGGHPASDYKTRLYF